MRKLLRWIKPWGLVGLSLVSCTGPEKSAHPASINLLRQELESRGRDLYQQQKWSELSETLQDSRWQSCLSQPLCQHDWTLLHITALNRLGKTGEALRGWSSVRSELISGNFWSWLYFYEGSRLLASTHQLTKSLALIEESKKTAYPRQWSLEQQIVWQFREDLLRSFVHSQKLALKKTHTISPPAQKSLWTHTLAQVKSPELPRQSLEDIYTMMAEDLNWLGQEEAQRSWAVRLWRMDAFLQLSLLGAHWEIPSAKKLEFIDGEWSLAKKEALLPTKKSLRNARLLQLQSMLNTISSKEATISRRQLASENFTSAESSELIRWLTQERKKLDQLLYAPVISPSSTRPWVEIYPNKATDSKKSF